MRVAPRVLVACEFSGTVREAFRSAGFDAWSCDLLPTEIPGPHRECDVREILSEGWDLMIAHPPCTHLSKAGGWAWKYKGVEQAEALAFVKELMCAPIPRIAIENPVGYLSVAWRKPDQIIHPYHFGDPWMKETCLWLKGLPPLLCLTEAPVEPQGNWVKPGNKRKRRFNNVAEGGKGNAKDRSRFFPGIAQAMVAQ